MCFLIEIKSSLRQFSITAHYPIKNFRYLTYTLTHTTRLGQSHIYIVILATFCFVKIKYVQWRGEVRETHYFHKVSSLQLKWATFITFFTVEVTIIALIVQFVFYIEGKCCITKHSSLKFWKLNANTVLQ